MFELIGKGESNGSKVEWKPFSNNNMPYFGVFQLYLDGEAEPEVVNIIQKIKGINEPVEYWVFLENAYGTEPVFFMDKNCYKLELLSELELKDKFGIVIEHKK